MPVSGKEMVRMYIQNGWRIERKRGSHIILKKDEATEVIPDHKELGKGLESKLKKRIG